MKKIIIFSSVSFIVILLLIIFVIFPLFSNIKRISNDILTTKKSFASFENDVVRAEQFKESYEDLEITPETIENNLVNPSAPIDLIGFLENLADQENISIDITPASVITERDDPWNAIGFSLRLGGDFQDVMRFLDKIEASSYFIETKKLHSKRLESKDISSAGYMGLSAGDITTTLEIKVFTK